MDQSCSTAAAAALSTLPAEELRYARGPCPYPPGGAEKIAVMTLRASLRLPLFVAGDYSEAFAGNPRYRRR